jgi:hypothetical protein
MPGRLIDFRTGSQVNYRRFQDLIRQDIMGKLIEVTDGCAAQLRSLFNNAV